MTPEYLKQMSNLTHLLPMHTFSTPWKHQKTFRYSDVFKGLRKSALRTNGLTRLSVKNSRANTTEDWSLLNLGWRCKKNVCDPLRKCPYTETFWSLFSRSDTYLVNLVIIRNPKWWLLQKTKEDPKFSLIPQYPRKT